MLFVTKCPCDECVPLISGAGITHIYTSDQDRDKVKVDISYLRFSSLRNISKFIVSPQTDGGIECPAADAVRYNPQISTPIVFLFRTVAEESLNLLAILPSPHQ